MYEAVDRKVEEVLARLLADGGPDPSFAERLAATRAAHARLAAHVLETRAALLPAGSAAAAALDKRVSQADRRLHAALKSLAALRRLRRPAAVTQVNVVATLAT
ncbi:MAG: hypothetical protein K2X82_17570 [Gemmataceae bacterium]|nr:hypothetical protein [Gemmataceae bacterium]